MVMCQGADCTKHDVKECSLSSLYVLIELS